MKRDFFRKIISLFFLLILYISISAFSYANTVSTHLADSVFRLHILANSDSVEDQNLIECANNHIEDFKQVAKQIITENGYDYDVSVSIGNFSFPTKEYGDISLPAGFYDALRIEIGEAKR